MAPIAAHKHMYAKGSNIDNRIGEFKCPTIRASFDV